MACATQERSSRTTQELKVSYLKAPYMEDGQDMHLKPIGEPRGERLSNHTVTAKSGAYSCRRGAKGYPQKEDLTLCVDFENRDIDGNIQADYEKRPNHQGKCRPPYGRSHAWFSSFGDTYFCWKDDSYHPNWNRPAYHLISGTEPGGGAMNPYAWRYALPSSFDRTTRACNVMQDIGRTTPRFRRNLSAYSSPK